jgi:hypothetical protein
VVLVDLSPVIAATAQWLIRAYPVAGDTLTTALAQIPARQATKIAAWLRYPTLTDAGLLLMVGPGGSARLDWLVGAEQADRPAAEHAWRTWVDEVVASWAACLLADPVLAATAVAALRDCEHMAGLHCDFRRLTAPQDSERSATALLRHPDLLAPIAELHRAALLERLRAETVDAA